VITDRELDVQLAGAAGIRDADLPALPEGFLEHVQAEDFLGYLMGDTGAEPASVVAARQLVADAHEARTARPRRRRRNLLLRAGAAAIVVAAAWTAAVVVTPAERPGSPDGPTAPAEGIILVAAEQAAFPLTLEPPPAGLEPTFSMFGGVGYYGDAPLVYTADYYSGGDDRVLLNLFEEDPRGTDDGPFEGAPDGSVTVAGTTAEVRRGSGSVDLLWERTDGRWARVLGEGGYGDLAALVPVAESVVDRPQPLGLQFGLAPAGWSLTGYEESRSIDLTRDGDVTQLLRLSVLPPGTATLDDVVGGPDLTVPPTPVTIRGREGRLALVHGGENPDFWRAAGEFADGSRFLLLAPQVLTEEQVLQIAEQITYTP
jgi:hypothetical protein